MVHVFEKKGCDRTATGHGNNLITIHLRQTNCPGEKQLGKDCWAS